MPDAAGNARLVSQVVNSFQGVKRGFQEKKTDLYKAIQKTANDGPMAGVFRKYNRRDDDGVQFPEEYRRVQFTAEDMLAEFLESFVRLADVSATMDVSNTIAKADVKVGDNVIVSQAPPTLLLSLEKQLEDVRAFVQHLPVLDPATEWEWSPEAGAYASRPTGTVKTDKVIEPVVLYPATEQHPAQVQGTTRDVVIGTWETVKFSGYVRGDQIKKWTDRIDTLLLAVKYAREEANATTSVEAVKVGGAVRTYLMAD